MTDWEPYVERYRHGEWRAQKGKPGSLLAVRICK